MNHLSIGDGRFRAFSAGSHPKGVVHPLTLEVLGNEHLPTSGLRSKSWDEFAGPNAPTLDVVITVCDQAAAEACPYWPGHPMTAHWGVPDPAAAGGTEADRRRAFKDAFLVLRRRIQLFAGLPLDTLSGPALRDELDRIGQQ